MAIGYWIHLSLYCVLFAHGARIIEHKKAAAPCDLTQVNMKKYGKLIKKQCPASGCKFWDSCPKDGGKCSSGCLPYSEALGLTFSQRSTKAMGHAFSGSCEKQCRYTDDAMLKTAEDAGAFAATSAAVLEDKLVLQEKECGGLFSAMSATCGARQRKIASLFGFLMRDLNEASKYAAAGDISKCNTALPSEIRAQLSADISSIVEKMVSAGQVDSKATKQLRALAKIPTLTNLCEGLHQINAAQPSQPKSTSDLRATLQKAAGGNISEADLDRAIAMVEEKGAQTLLDQQLKKDEEQLDTALTEVYDTAGSYSLAQIGSQGIITGVFTGFWSLLLHATIGTLVGAFSTVMCLITVGNWAEVMEFTEAFEGSRRSAWLLTCPVMMMGSAWGFRGKYNDFAHDVGLDWESVMEAFMDRSF